MDLRETRLPRYAEIAESLRGQIENGELNPGDRLPSERELSRALGVTRPTLRQALLDLELEGLLRRRPGAGTFVAEPKIERLTGRLSPFTRGMEQKGLEPGARVLLVETRPASKSIAARLQLTVSAPLFYCHRLRLIGGEPMMLEKFYLPAQLVPAFDTLDLSGSIYQALEQQYGVVVQRAQQSLEAVAASKQEAQLLCVAPGDPLLMERRIAFDPAGHPVEYAKDLYRGDRFRFLSDVER
ncbi:MAG: GntR family transcriptional regulator [Myxococcales bacterium]|nr:GntR family transcriptional regulator [Myxococcales bacterium]